MKVSVFFFLAILFTALHANMVEYLVDTKHYPSTVILFYRGLLGIIITTVIARIKKENAFPKDWKIQRIRLINSGLILLAIFESYKHLSATNVSLMARMDIPLIVLFSIFFKEQKSVFQTVLSILTIIATFLLVYFEIVVEEHKNSLNTSDWIGFSLISFAAILLAINSRLVKQSVVTDNAFIITNITCISTMVMSFVTTKITGQSFYFNISDLGYLLLLTIFLILSYYYLVELYKVYTAERVQFTGVIATIGTMFFEMIFENRLFPLPEIIAVSFISFLTYLISTDGKNLKTVLNNKLFKNTFFEKVELYKLF